MAIRKSKIVITTALAGASFFSYGRRAYGAYAGCHHTSGTSYLCDSSDTATQAFLNKDNAAITVQTGFNVVTSSGNAISINGNGALSFTDTSTVNSVTIETSANNRRGIDMYSFGDIGGTPGSITINANSTINATGFGIYSNNAGSGATNITVNGDITSTTRTGIVVSHYGSDLNVTVGSSSNINAYRIGVGATNSGTGSINLIINGDITSRYAAVRGISYNSSAQNLNISIAQSSTIDATNAGSSGIIAKNYGIGSTNITVHGDVSASSTDSNYKIGVIYDYNHSHTGESNITIDGGHVAGNGSLSPGITAYHKYGTIANVTIENGGSVTSASNAAISTDDHSGSKTNTRLNVVLDGSASPVTVSGGGGTAIDFYDQNDNITITGDVNIAGNVNGGAGTDTLDITTAKVNMTSGSFTNFESVNITGAMTLIAGKTIAIGSTTPIAVNGGSLKVAVASDTSFGKITGSNGITFSNGGAITIDASSIGTITSGTTLSNVFSGGAVSGITAGVLSDNSPIYKFVSIINSNSIDVLVQSDSLASAGNSTNTSAVGSALDSVSQISNDTSLQNVIDTISNYSTDAQKEAALKTLTPDVSGSNIQASIQVSNSTNAVIEGHMENTMLQPTGIATGGQELSHGVWGEAFGSNITQGFRKGVDGYDANIGGFIVGTDGMFGKNAKIGVALSYANTSAKSDSSKTNIGTSQATIYSSYDFDKMYLEGLGSAAVGKFTTSRTLFDGSVASADYEGYQFSAKGTAGYRTHLGGLNVIPFASLQYNFITQQDYTETGSNANLSVSTDNMQVLKSGLGAKVGLPAVIDGVTYYPHASMAWYYDFINDAVQTDSSFASSPSIIFANSGTKPARNSFKLGAGLDMLSADNVTISLDYNLEARETYRSHTGELKARMGF